MPPAPPRTLAPAAFYLTPPIAKMLRGPCHRYPSEPIQTRSNYVELAQSAGKRLRKDFPFNSDWTRQSILNP